MTKDIFNEQDENIDQDNIDDLEIPRRSWRSEKRRMRRERISATTTRFRLYTEQKTGVSQSFYAIQINQIVLDQMYLIIYLIIISIS